MIVRGDFESVSMAIYGEVVTDAVAPVTSYTPGLPQLPEPVSISPALDLANASDPTCLARQLLALIPDPPSLNLVIRLMFCLKLPNDDWDLPEFPHLYSDLNEEDMDIDLDSAFRCLSRPVAENVSVESLQRFAEKIVDAIGPMVWNDLFYGYFSRLTISRQVGQYSGLSRVRNTMPFCFTKPPFRTSAYGVSFTGNSICALILVPAINRLEKRV